MMTTQERNKELTDTLMVHASNANIQKKGIEDIRNFNVFCMGQPGNGECRNASNSLKNAIITLTGYKSTGSTDGHNAANIKGMASAMYKNCLDKKCEKCLDSYKAFDKYLRVNNLSNEGE